ncbi:MAG: hypothetical protein M0Z85_12685 [Gammaproteobacteria bacterium]|nr:hypothetical protein [Gammaproteobacteria bacterium]
MADWLELRTLMDARGVSTRASLLNVLDILEDEAADQDPVDTETGDVLDEAILEGQRQQFVDVTFEELDYRQRLLAESYPFEVDARRYRLTRRVDEPASHPGQVVYLFCLLSSAIRERRLQPQNALAQAEQDIADTFQVCACLAAGGYLNGEVSAFGFPRATGTNFLTALRQTFTRFGIGAVRRNDDIPDGLPTSLKDGGIDVIAWRDHPDGMPGKLYLIGQCASGLHWREKSVVEYIRQLHGSWFTQRPAEHSTPAMFIPFPFHHDIDERPGPYLEAVRNRFWHEEPRFGVIFDRLRITHFANACMAFATPRRERVEGAERFDRVVAWVESTRQTAGLVRA